MIKVLKKVKRSDKKELGDIERCPIRGLGKKEERRGGMGNYIRTRFVCCERKKGGNKRQGKRMG